MKDSPRLSPRTEPATLTAAAGTFTFSSSDMDSRMRMAVIILVVDAMSNCLSASREYRTDPVSMSITIAACAVTTGGWG